MALFSDSVINLDFNKAHKLIYGWPGTGKTPLAACMVDAEGRRPTFAATEDRHNSLVVSRARIKSWEGFMKYTEHLEKNAQQLTAEHSCIVLDVVSDVDQWCAAHVAKLKKIEHVSDLDQGKGWHMMREIFQQQMNRLMALRPVVFVAHAQDKRTMLNGEQVVTTAPNLSKSAMEYINGKVDAIMYIRPANSKKLNPEITMRPTMDSIAKSSQSALCRDFPIDVADPNGFAKVYGEICRIYAEAQLKMVPVAPIVQPQPPQAAQA